jgi:hypothetical protein
MAATIRASRRAASSECRLSWLVDVALKTIPVAASHEAEKPAELN